MTLQPVHPDPEDYLIKSFGTGELMARMHGARRLLLQNAGKVLTHRQLLRQVWAMAYEAEMHILQVNISNLRHKIETDPSRPHYLLTEPGVGYRIRM